MRVKTVPLQATQNVTSHFIFFFTVFIIWKIWETVLHTSEMMGASLDLRLCGDDSLIILWNTAPAHDRKFAIVRVQWLIVYGADRLIQLGMTDAGI